MEHEFWHNKWEKNDIAFHSNQANPLLVSHFSALSLEKNQRIFLPLCGKTRDIAWLLNQGYGVVGAELSKLAIEQLFAELGVTPSISSIGNLELYQSTHLDIFVGDIFELTHDVLGGVDAIYDRAALVALPLSLRTRYTSHLISLTNAAPQLLICYDYDQTALDGPPFSISDEEVQQHYTIIYDILCLSSSDLEGGLKGVCAAKENVWLLKKK